MIVYTLSIYLYVLLLTLNIAKEEIHGTPWRNRVITYLETWIRTMTDGVHFINCIHLKLKIQVTSQKLFIHTPGWHPLNIQEKQIEKKTET